MSGTAVPGQRVTSTLVGVPAWTGMTLANGWTNHGGGSAPAQYRLWQLLNEVEIIGYINPGTITDGTTIATLPNAPVSAQRVNAQIITTTGAASGVTATLGVDTFGDLLCFGIPTGTTFVGFHGWYSLDA